MTVFKDKSRKSYRFGFVRGGHRYQSKDYPTRREAEAAEANLKRKLDAGHTAAFSTFLQLTEGFLVTSARTKSAEWTYQLQRKLNRYWGHLAPVPLEDLTPGHIEHVLNRMHQDGALASTINEERKIINSVLNYGVRMRALKANPAASITRMPEPEAEVDPIPTEHLKCLIVAASEGMASLLIVMSQTAIRFVEARRLGWDHVHLNQAEPFIIVSTKKSGAVGNERLRPVPLTRMAAAALAGRPQGSSSWVWTSPRTHGPLSRNTGIHRLRDLCAHAGVPRYSFHQVRHWAGMQVTMMGKNKKSIAKLLGHQNTAATDRYMHAVDAEMWEMVNELERNMSVALGEAGQERSGG